MAILSRKLELTSDTWVLIGAIGVVGTAQGGVDLVNADSLPTGSVVESTKFDGGKTFMYPAPAAGNLYVKASLNTASLSYYEV